MGRRNLGELLDCIMVVDSGGSMRYRRKKISKKATAIADKYLAKGKKVAVFNFGYRSIITDFSRNKRKIHQAIRRYQGGGADFNKALLENFVDDYEDLEHQVTPKVDVIVVSDMSIYNFNNFAAFIKDLSKKQHKIYLLQILNIDYSPFTNPYVSKTKQLQAEAEGYISISYLKVRKGQK